MTDDVLLQSIVAPNREAVGHAAAAVNQSLVLRNCLIGAYLVEFEQTGEDRAAYGEHSLERVSGDLKQRGVRRLGISMLRNCRLGYRLYPQIRQALTDNSGSTTLRAIRQSPIGEFDKGAGAQPIKPGNGPTPLGTEQLVCLSWTHLIELIRLDDPWKRAFSENECLGGNWSVRQLQRQIGSLLYERTGLSTEKQIIIERAREQAR